MISPSEPKPIVSVVIPTIGRPDRLRCTLQTVLNQSLDPRLYEVLVVDDASSETYQWLPDRVRLVRRTQRGGPGGARNVGIAGASCEVIAFTDDDCLVPDQWLALLLDAFRRFPSAAAVGGPLLPDPSHMDRAPARLERRQVIDYYRGMGVDPLRDETVASADASPAWGTNNLAWRAGHLRDLGGFLEGTSASEDRDLAARAGAVGHVTVFTPVVVHHNREYSWKDLWRRYRSGPFPGGGRRGLISLMRSLLRLPRALARDLLLVPTRDPGLVAAAVLRDVALSVGAARAAISSGG